MDTLILMLIKIIDLYLLNLTVYLIIDWLAILKIIKLKNRLFDKFYYFLKEVNDPIFDYIKKFMPKNFYIDFSFLIAFLGASLLKSILISLL